MVKTPKISVQKKIMKIGILTLPLHTNYGGIIQAYALQTVLQRLGHEVSEIEMKREWTPSYPPSLEAAPIVWQENTPKVRITQERSEGIQRKV